MSAFVVAHQSRVAAYGAEELKQFAHRYGFYALSISIVIHFGLIGSFYLTEMGHPGIVKLPPINGPGIDVELPPYVPGVYKIPPRVDLPVPLLHVHDGIPIPVADNRVPIDQTLPTQGERVDGVDPHGSELLPGGSGISGEEIIDDNKPPGPFVAFEKPPEVVKAVAPVYPPLALKAELEGRVFVKIWVDRQGKVRDVVILKSDYDIFNEAAIEAARQFVFTPAYMNNGPVAVWVAFPFSFKLKNG